MKPIVAVDVDGVLLPFGKPWELNPLHGQWLLSLADRAELVWATSWEHLANVDIGPSLGLPTLPVIEFNSLHKTGSVQDYAAGRPLVWIDDFFAANTDVIEWGRNRPEPTLLIAPAPTIGLEEWHIQRISGWLDYLGYSSLPYA